MRRPLSLNTRLFAALALFAPLLFASSERAAAQSTDIAYPAPVFSNEITGRIQPRDPGDARQTRHFYVFRGTEGDVTVTVESAQLSGDVDVFAGRALRPLLKVSMFGGTATKATKSVYLRREETLILRVEARAVGDAEGSYRVLLGGSFAPAPPELAQQSVPETTTPAPDTSERRGTRRVTSTGARIDEPPRPEVAEATPTPTPEATPAETTARVEERTAATREPARTRRGRNTRGTTNRRRAPAAQPTPSPDAPATDETAASRTGEESRPDERRPEAETANPAATTPATTSRRRGSRESNRRRATPAPSAPSAEAADSPPAAPPPAVTITRLVILTKDGRTLERDMQTVRRVTIENNQVVVTLKDGKAVRTPLANVEKMSFEP